MFKIKDIIDETLDMQFLERGTTTRKISKVVLWGTYVITYPVIWTKVNIFKK